MSRNVLRTTNKATWDEQVATPERLTPGSTLHAHTGAPSGTLGDTRPDVRVYRFRVTA